MKLPILNFKPIYVKIIKKIININYIYLFLKIKKKNNFKKNKRLIRGSGIKPWPQKGTGRARSGDKKSPIWRGGGVTFSNYFFKKKYKKIKKVFENFFFLFLLSNRIFIYEKNMFFYIYTNFNNNKNLIFNDFLLNGVKSIKKININDFLKYNKIFFDVKSFFFLINNIFK